MTRYYDDCPVCERAERHIDKLEKQIDELTSKLLEAWCEINRRDSEISHFADSLTLASDSLPSEDGCYLAWSKKRGFWIEEFVCGEGWVGTCPITAWRPLPEAPRGEQQPNIPLPAPSLGNCSKCGAPYVSSHTGPWHAIIPPPIHPSCNCWEHIIGTTSSTKEEQ